ncbi:hypothetical protein [Hyphomonas sp.]|uniref:hypothetical protein n=1 Tax=Hyphomonas sp. TaxID=87 RepID=UPI003919C3F2
MSGAGRILAGPEIDRLLAAGGMLAETEAGWLAYRRRDGRTRAAGSVPLRIVERLQDEGVLTELKHPGGRWASRAALAAEQALPAPPAHLTFLTAPRPRRVALILTLLTDPKLAPAEAARLKAAGQRFLADLEQAATPQRVTMRWDGLPLGVGAPAGGGGPVQPAASAALGRLEAVQRSIGRAMFRRAEALLAERATRRSFAELCGCAVKEVSGAGLDCLRQLARAYALDVRVPR